EIALSAVAPTAVAWANYILGIVDQIQKKNQQLSGFNLYIDGDVPLGAGLSSSAAVECATGFALNDLFNLHVCRQEVGLLGRRAEDTLAGGKCGFMDQFASVLSRQGHVVQVDCRALSCAYGPLDRGGHELVLLNPNDKCSSASSA